MTTSLAGWTDDDRAIEVDPKNTSLRTSLALAIAITVFYLALTPWTTLWDRDEPRFARATVEMIESGNYLYPTFNGELRPHKPILVYWLMSLSMRVLGPTEVAARFWSPVGLALAAFFTFLAGRRLYSNRVGLAAMIALAINPLVALEALAATTDALLLAAMTGSLVAFVWIRADGPRAGTVACLVAGLAAGQLLKGPVGLVVPAGVMGATLIASWRTRPPRLGLLLTLGGAAIASVALFGAWAIPANAATGGSLLADGLVAQMAQRIWRPLEGHGGFSPLYLAYYLPAVAIGFLPWTRWLPAALRSLHVRDVGSRDTRVLLWAWILVPLALFTLAVTKLPHYVLPIWPALALVTAGLVVSPTRVQAPQLGRWLTAGWWLTLFVTALSVAALPVAIRVLSLPSLVWPAVALAVISLAVVLASTRATRRCRHLEAAGISAGGMAAALAVAVVWAGPTIDARKPVPRLVADLRGSGSPDVPVSVCEAGEPSLIFYLGRPVVAELPRHALAQWSQLPGAAILITTREVLRDPGVPDLSTRLTWVASAAGLNVATGRHVELIAFCRACGP